MRLAISITIVCLVVVLCLVWHLVGSVNVTNDPIKLFKTYLKRHPMTKGLCMGYDRKNHLYINVRNETFTTAAPTVSHDKFPINNQGRLYDPHGSRHRGDIIKTTDGFRIVGVNNMTFKCPPGYEGLWCVAKPLCSEGDEGVLKPITAQQFDWLLNEERLLDDTSPLKMNNDGRHHPRIRVQCLDKNKYNLEMCAENQLLNIDTMRCEPYDVCHARADGYAHHYAISASDPPLERDEYYVCTHNRSKLRKCTLPDFVFSEEERVCVTETPCVGKGDATVKLDELRYAQCHHDESTVVDCSGTWLHYDPDTARYSCGVGDCRERVYTYDDGHVAYVYGRRSCHKGLSSSQMCDSSDAGMEIQFSWGEERFTFRVPHWPKEFLSTSDNKCHTPNEIRNVWKNPVYKMRYSSAMLKRHPFNMHTLLFDCPKKYNYTNDYVNGRTIPESPSEMYVDSASPCQMRAYERYELPWTSFVNIQLPERTGNGPVLPISVGARVYLEGSDAKNLNLWPYYDAKKQIIYGASVEYDYVELAVVIKRYTCRYPPFGFHVDSNTNLVEMTGGPTMSRELINSRNLYQWYTIHTGEMRAPNYVHGKQKENDVATKETRLRYKSIIDTTKDYGPQTPPFWTLFPKDNTAIKLTDRLSVSRQGFIYDDRLYPAAFAQWTLTQIKGNVSKVAFNYAQGTLECEFDSVRFPSFRFPSRSV